MTTSTQSDLDQLKGPCKICQGKFSDHANSVHAFTQLDGDLVTKAQDEKRNQKPQPAIIRLPGGTQNEGGAINRLIEVLLERDAITTEEALYICGVKQEKYSDEIKRRFRQPPVSSGGISGAVDL